MIRLIIDEQIPLIPAFLPSQVHVRRLPGRAIERIHVKDADALIVRSVTRVNADLLEGSSVSFVASATSGTDHIDMAWCAEAGIPCYAAAGCNAQAVAEYVLSVVAWLRVHGWLSRQAFSALVIGVGHVGSRVGQLLNQLGAEVILNDPPRHEREPHFISTPLESCHSVDLICVHTPLTYEGHHPTHHLINERFLSRQKEGTIILNAGRGGVIDEAALQAHHARLKWCLDVWENEPDIDQTVLRQALIATPHIAGYSAMAKFQAVKMVMQHFVEHFHLSKDILVALAKRSPSEQTMDERFKPGWEESLLAGSNPGDITKRMHQSLLGDRVVVGKAFDILRQSFEPELGFNVGIN